MYQIDHRHHRLASVTATNQPLRGKYMVIMGKSNKLLRVENTTHSDEILVINGEKRPLDLFRLQLSFRKTILQVTI